MSLFYVQIPDFFVHTHATADPGLVDKPFAVHRSKKIVQANPLTTRMGIRPGMSLTEARSICRDLIPVEWSEDLYRPASHRWLDVLCEASDCVEPVEFAAAFVDLGGHPVPESVAQLLLDRIDEVLYPPLAPFRGRGVAHLRGGEGDQNPLSTCGEGAGGGENRNACVSQATHRDSPKMLRTRQKEQPPVQSGVSTSSLTPRTGDCPHPGFAGLPPTGEEPVPSAFPLHPSPIHPSPSAPSPLERGEGSPWPAVRGAITPTKWVSQVLASTLSTSGERAGGGAKHTLIIVRNPAKALEKLPVAYLLPLTEAERQRLDFLGYKTIGRVRELSMATLRRQFDDRALTIYNAARGLCSDPVLPLYPESSLAARINFPDGTDDRETLQRGLRKVVKVLVARLSDRDEQALGAILTILTESGAITRKRSFARPLGTVSSLLHVASSMIEPPPHEPILELRLRLPELQKAQCLQSTFSLASVPRPESLIVAERVKNRYGDGAIMRASQKPKPRREEVLHAWKQATHWS